ncbi:hypothetical protein [Actinomadura vinacea]|uniref:hypothetical protein n=1 Tax=Actinomadura vinacea TaxID=115336 RepID=UPI0031DA7BD1
MPYFPLARHIGTRLRDTLAAPEMARVAMRPFRPDQMHRGMADQLGAVSLIIAAPPAYKVGGRRPEVTATGHCPACRADLWRLSKQQLSTFLNASWRVLRPGGHLAVITTARYQDDGRLIDPAPQIIRDARTAGLRYSQHIIAVRVPVDGDSLLVQVTPTSFGQLRDVRSRAMPPAARVHADISLFSKPAMSAGSRKLKGRRDEPKGQVPPLPPSDPWVRGEGERSDS